MRTKGLREMLYILVILFYRTNIYATVTCLIDIVRVLDYNI